ncbi:hypothetical protein HDA32_002535 [Spinactinospora alkalitolerans]|uniref:Uncharacterized protein n=1 Tax=Spinactinospora alkalitolerans TaxID=687207 RepID=A0A852TVJ4_9ACTN|nr:hypothetical protein [Spinactinospora alkalitolerans]
MRILRETPSTVLAPEDAERFRANTVIAIGAFATVPLAGFLLAAPGAKRDPPRSAQRPEQGGEAVRANRGRRARSR